MRRVALLIALLALFCADARAEIGTLRFANGLASPVYLTAPPGDPNRVFVVESAGDIEILDTATGTPRSEPFLTLPDVGGNNDFMSMAFHPDYASNGYFFVYFQSSDATCRLVRYTRSASDPDLADPNSAQTVLDLPTGIGHVGGWTGFTPDGYLMLHVGDNGNFMSHDAPNNAQNTTGELLGNALRLDVDGDDFPTDPNRNYAIPPTNPFVGVAGEDEIWAYGLRNPWRGSFDRGTGDYFIADVGQDNVEEIDFEIAGSPGGRNYGWRLREGSIATPTGGVGGPQPPGGVDPVYEYTHGAGTAQGMSITGGYVYRGPVSALRGRYFFADFISERIWTIRLDRQTELVSEFLDWTDAFVPDVGAIEQIVSFGEDAVGNLYIVDFGGEIFRVTGPVAIPVLPGAAASLLVVALGGLALALSIHRGRA